MTHHVLKFTCCWLLFLQLLTPPIIRFRFWFQAKLIQVFRFYFISVVLFRLFYLPFYPKICFQTTHFAFFIRICTFMLNSYSHILCLLIYPQFYKAILRRKNVAGLFSIRKIPVQSISFLHLITKNNAAVKTGLCQLFLAELFHLLIYFSICISWAKYFFLFSLIRWFL